MKMRSKVRNIELLEPRCVLSASMPSGEALSEDSSQYGLSRAAEIAELSTVQRGDSRGGAHGDAGRMGRAFSSLNVRARDAAFELQGLSELRRGADRTASEPSRLQASREFDLIATSSVDRSGGQRSSLLDRPTTLTSTPLHSNSVVLVFVPLRSFAPMSQSFSITFMQPASIRVSAPHGAPIVGGGHSAAAPQHPPRGSVRMPLLASPIAAMLSSMTAMAGAWLAPPQQAATHVAPGAVMSPVAFHADAVVAWSPDSVVAWSPDQATVGAWSSSQVATSVSAAAVQNKLATLAVDRSGEGGLITLERHAPTDETQTDKLGALEDLFSEDPWSDALAEEKPVADASSVENVRSALEPVESELAFAAHEGGLVSFDVTNGDQPLSLDPATDVSPVAGQSLAGQYLEIPMDASVRLFQAFETAAEPAGIDADQASEFISIPTPIEASSGDESQAPAAVSVGATPAIIVGAMVLGANYRRRANRSAPRRG